MLIPDPDPDEPFRVRVKLLDFGVAKLIGTLAEDRGPGTLDSAIIGTPEYMSPEQARDSGKVSDKTDVYALGIMLFEMLTGHVPFESPSPTEVLAKHMYEPLPSRSQWASQLPSPLIEVTEEMLSKEPKKRPSMDKLMTQLDEIASMLGRHSGQRSRPRLPILVSSAQSELFDSKTFSNLTLAGSTETAPIIYRRKWRSRLAAIATLVLLASTVWTLTTESPATRNQEIGQTPAALSRPPGDLALGGVPSTIGRWTILTIPPGAQVIRVETGERLGVTPWHGTPSRSTGEVVVRLQLEGYQSRLISLDSTLDVEKQETLIPLLNSSAPPANSREASVPPTAKRTGKATKHFKKRPVEEPEVEE